MRESEHVILKKGAVAGKRKAAFPLPISFRFSFPADLVSCSRFPNFADPTILEPGTQDRNENDSGPTFKDFFKIQKTNLT